MENTETPKPVEKRKRSDKPRTFIYDKPYIDMNGDLVQQSPPNGDIIVIKTKAQIEAETVKPEKDDEPQLPAELAGVPPLEISEEITDPVELAKSGIPALMRRAVLLASISRKPHEVLSVLKELCDRAYGKPVQGIYHGGQVGVDVTIADVLKSIDGKTTGLPQINREDFLDG